MNDTFKLTIEVLAAPKDFSQQVNRIVREAGGEVVSTEAGDVGDALTVRISSVALATAWYAGHFSTNEAAESREYDESIAAEDEVEGPDHSVIEDITDCD